MKTKPLAFILTLMLASLCCSVPLNGLVPPAASAPAQDNGSLVSPGAPAGAQDLTPYPSTPDTFSCAQVTALEALHLRQQGNDSAPVIAWLKYGETLQVLQRSGKWWLVTTGLFTGHPGELRQGYVNSNYLQEVSCP